MGIVALRIRGDYRDVSEGDVFHKETLDVSDGTPPTASTDATTETPAPTVSNDATTTAHESTTDCNGLRYYRRRMALHFWLVQRRNNVVIDKKAMWVFVGQICFICFLSLIMLIGGAMTIAVGTRLNSRSSAQTLKNWTPPQTSREESISSRSEHNDMGVSPALAPTQEVPRAHEMPYATNETPKTTPPTQPATPQKPPPTTIPSEGDRRRYNRIDEGTPDSRVPPIKHK